MTTSEKPDVPITFTYDPTRRLRTAVFSGLISDEMMLVAYGDLIAQPDYDLGADDLVDMRPVTHLGVTADGMRRLMQMFGEIDRVGVPTRLAMLAPGDAVYGVSRMYQMLRGDDVPEEIAVFRDENEALAWLAAGRAARESAA